MRVYLTSPWIPAEWVRAHDLEPRGIWFAEKFRPDAPPLAGGVCAFAESVVRFAETQPASAVVFTTACDQLRRGFDAAAFRGASRVFLFNLPATQTPVAGQIYRAELERLGQFLLALGGSAPTPERLQREMAQSDEARRRLREAAPAAAARSYAEAVARFHTDGSFYAPAVFQPANSAPLALVGGPLSATDWNLFDTIEAAGGRVALNATLTGERSLCPAFECPIKPWRQASLPAVEPGFQPGGENVAIENVLPSSDCRPTTTAFSGRQDAALYGRQGCPPPQSPFHALAAGYIENLVDVFQRPNTQLYSWLKPRLLARRICGIVLWHFTGCDLWRAEFQTLREVSGMPVLLLEADEAAGISPRDTNRLQAFVEMVGQP